MSYPPGGGRNRVLSPDDVGFRVVVRRALPDGRATDVLGELESWTAGVLMVRRSAGTVVQIPVTEVIAGRRVPKGPVRLRPARLTDAEAIRRLRVQAWRGAAGETVTEWVAESGTVAGTVAGTAVVGWAVGGACRDSDRGGAAESEIYACYVVPSWSGMGVGGRLLRRTLAGLDARGRSSVSRWVPESDDRARRFYAAHGFLPDGTRQPLDLGGPVAEIRCLRPGAQTGGS
jgi:GNAT superfamily N-acetyltransferase